MPHLEVALFVFWSVEENPEIQVFMWKPHLKISGSIRTRRKKIKHCADRVHLQDRCPDQNHRPPVYDLCPAQSASVLLCNHSSWYSFPCLPHSHHSGFLSGSRIVWALTNSGSFVLLVLCLGLFGVLLLQTSAQLSLPQSGIFWPLSKFTTPPFVFFLCTSGSQSVV